MLALSIFGPLCGANISLKSSAIVTSSSSSSKVFQNSGDTLNTFITDEATKIQICDTA